MTKERQNKIIAAIIAFIFMILLWLLLWFIYIGIPQPEEDEGIEVAFGVVEDAGGYMAQQSEAVPLPAEATPPPPATAPSDNDLMTQEDEEALQLARQLLAQRGGQRVRLRLGRRYGACARRHVGPRRLGRRSRVRVRAARCASRGGAR